MAKFVSFVESKLIKKPSPVAVIESASKPGKTHTVFANPDGSLSCDCESYQFRNSCRHCREAAQGWLSTVSSLQEAAQQMRQQAERVIGKIDPAQTDRRALKALWERIEETQKQINSMVANARKHAE